MQLCATNIGSYRLWAGALVCAAASLALPAVRARAAEPAASPTFDVAALEFFEKQVRPVLSSRCFGCHSSQAKEVKGGLKLDSRAAIMKGGDTGPAVVAGNSKKSLLVDAVNYGDVYQMPPKTKLPPEEIAALTKWVDLGAPWPPHDAGGSSADPKEAFDLAKRKHDHWCWQPVAAAAPPAVKQAAWPRGPIDAFVLAKMEEKGLAPAADAEKATLLRRLTFDLTGLPPTPQEVDAFVNDTQSGALERVVDRLLKSPRFGERWARHWLDLVRYAESRGHEFDIDIPNAWQYRDYVIRALNDDVPYDQFVVEHLAGDLLEHARLNAKTGGNESILATGFWFLGEWIHSPVDIRKDETDRHDNMVDVMSKTFLGVTVACARCHDHKFDAISQADYYALSGYLQSSDCRQVAFESEPHNRQVAQELAKVRDRTRAVAGKAVAEALRGEVAQTGAYLLAVRELLTVGPNPAAAQVAKVASEKNLDAPRLTRWLAAVQLAAKDPRDALNDWSQLCLPGVSKKPVKKAVAVAKESSAGPGASSIIVDYSSPRADDFSPDGFAFGLAPVRTGDLLLGASPEKPLSGVASFGAVRRDLAWNGVKLAPGADDDSGALGGKQRSSRSFRTGGFDIGESGLVHYLVRGNGWAYAAVDTHRTIQGPLHGGLVREFNTGDKYQWVTHDLRAYKAEALEFHRAHLEFTPKGEGLLEVLAVAQGEKAPALGPAHAPLELPEGKPDADAAQVAAEYTAWFTAALDKLAENKLGESHEMAALGNWLLAHTDLFAAAAPQVSPQAAEELKQLFAEETKWVAEIRPTSPTAIAMWDGNSLNEHLLRRGSPRTPGEEVPRRLLEALGGMQAPAVAHGSGRLELAQQVVSPQNPLTARVLVNRVWHHLFGRGIVPTVDNFGVLGERPSHPELLDFLAQQFVQEGWSVKRLIRTIVLSHAYALASRPSDKALAEDPANVWLSHASVRRLEGESIRDAILAVSGRLDEKQFGPSVPIALTPFMEGRGRPGAGPLDGNGRRSIYLSIRRNFLSPMMLAFDMPIPFNANGRRNVSNVPAQALILMNDPFVVAEAKRWSTQVLAGANRPTDERITVMYRTAFARAPLPEELEAAHGFFTQQAAEKKVASEKAAQDPQLWADFAHVLLNAKEFIYLD